MIPPCVSHTHASTAFIYRDAQYSWTTMLMNIVKWLTICVVIGIAIPPPLVAQEPPRASIVDDSSNSTASFDTMQGVRWALLVGIANYPRSVSGYEIQPLRAPVKDVTALTELLKDPRRGGFDADHVFTLTDAEATRRNILITFNDIARRAQPEDMVIFYFSGHGYRGADGESTYLIPYDLDVRDFAATCINFDDLAKKIRAMQAKKAVVILDACHAGGVKPAGARAMASTGLVRRYLETFRKAEGRALLLSSDESEVSWETAENGVFTRFLLEGLNGEADANGDGIITFTEVAMYVEDKVPEYTRENFPRVQKPTRRYDFGQVRGDIPLAINQAERETFVQEQRNIFNQRTKAILRASLEGLDQELKEFSLQVIQSAYDKSISGELLTEQESLLLAEIDSLRTGRISVAEFAQRAQVIHEFDTSSQITEKPRLGTLYVDVKPPDAKVTILTSDGKSIASKDLIIQPTGQTKVSIQATELRAGIYRVIAEKDGYKSTIRTIEITTDGPTRITLTLEPESKPVPETKPEPEPETKPEPPTAAEQEPQASSPQVTETPPPTEPQVQKRQLPRGFIGIHGGLYAPVDEFVVDSYGKPWLTGGIDAGLRISKRGIYLMLSASYAGKSGDYAVISDGIGDEDGTTWRQGFSRFGLRYMNFSSPASEMMYVVDVLWSSTSVTEDVLWSVTNGAEEVYVEDPMEISSTGLGLGFGFRYKAFEFRTLADIIREDEVWLAGYNMTAGLVWNFK